MDREAKLEELWNLTVDRLLTEVADKESAPAWATASIKFLKENEIDVLPESASGLDVKYPFKTGT